MTELNRTNDRCDASTYLVIEGDKPKNVGCRAQAYVQVVNNDGMDLLFCRHHYNQYELALMEQGFAPVVDERHTIENVNKLVGSANV